MSSNQQGPNLATITYEVPLLLGGRDHSIVLMDAQHAMSGALNPPPQAQVVRGLSAARLQSPSIPGKMTHPDPLRIALLPRKRPPVEQKPISVAHLGRNSLQQKREMNSLMTKSGLIVRLSGSRQNALVAERFGGQPKFANPLGPGQYDPDKFRTIRLTKVKHGKFGKAPKFSDSESTGLGAAEREPVPPPGAYDYKRAIKQSLGTSVIEYLEETFPVMTVTGNQITSALSMLTPLGSSMQPTYTKSGRIVRPVTTFDRLSRSPRFFGRDAQIVKHEVGPGSYEPKTDSIFDRQFGSAYRKLQGSVGKKGYPPSAKIIRAGARQ